MAKIRLIKAWRHWPEGAEIEIGGGVADILVNRPPKYAVYVKEKKVETAQLGILKKETGEVKRKRKPKKKKD